jgi:hypothetical protein
MNTDVDRIDFAYELIERGVNENFGLEQSLYAIKFSDIFQSFKDAIDAIYNLFENIVLTFTRNMLVQDKIRIAFFREGVFGCIDIPFVVRDNFTADLLMNAFESVMQSFDFEYLNTQDVFTANVQIVSMPLGFGRQGLGVKKKQRPYISVKNRLKIDNNILKNTKDLTIQGRLSKMRSVIKIQNYDNMCLLRAILVAIAYYNNEPYKKTYKLPNNERMASHVKIIKKHLNLPETGCGLTEIFQIEAFLEDYCITLIDGHCLSKFYYKGPKKDKYLYILYSRSHYNVILSMKSYIEQPYYCDACNVAYPDVMRHSCPSLCNTCKQSNCNLSEEKYLKCSNCTMRAKNIHCLQRHQDLICNKRKICPVCSNLIGKTHICLNQQYCQKCKLVVERDHLCYIKPKPEKLSSKKFSGLIFFDYEALVENGIHVPNLIVAHKVCVDCLDKQELCNNNCEKICVDNNNTFCEWLFNQANYIAIAHNARGYDSIFINEWINENVNNSDSLPQFIRIGSKILSIDFRNVKIIDSLSFLPMPLDNFAKTFNLAEMKKGFFPHLFNLRSNQNYIGKYPPEIDYQSKFMSIKKKAQFEEWYSKVIYDKNGKETVFDFKKEIIAYCESDVDILRKGCLAFRKIIIAQTKSEVDPEGIDPFQRTLTIASLTHLIYKNDHLIPDSIPILPENGFNTNQITSKKATCWLKFISKSQNISIQHAENFGEIQIDNYRGDGFDPLTNTVYEFHG